MSLLGIQQHLTLPTTNHRKAIAIPIVIAIGIAIAIVWYLFMAGIFIWQKYELPLINMFD